MSELILHETELVTEDGRKVRLVYEEVGDILEIVFDGVEATSAIELTDNIVLRFHREQERAAGLTFLDFSVLASPAELGVRSFALSGLEDLPEELRATVARIITTPPVNQFLKVTTFFASPTDQVPLAYVQSPSELALVA